MSKWMPTVGVIGMGFVGGSIFRGFNLYADVRGYDVDTDRSPNTFEEVIAADYIFVALPTPMARVDGGRCSTHLIDEAIGRIIADPGYYGGIIVIKSTIPPGTTDAMSAKHDSNRICHSPEFLTERSALADFLTPSRLIVGSNSYAVGQDMRHLYNHRFPGVDVKIMKPIEAELVKYGANCFFATKVIYFNELYMLCQAIGADWDQVLGGVMSDGRIGHSHNQCPGWDGDFGYGGKCLVKDLNALISVFEDNGVDPKLMKAAWDQNKAIRNNWDWAEIKGAVLDT